MAQSSITECNTALDARNALANGGTVEIKTGSNPDIDGAPSGTVLEIFTLSATAFAPAVNRVATLNTVSPIVATSEGTGEPYHYALKNSGGTIMRSGTAGTSGTDMIISQAVWAIGDSLEIVSWTTTQPK